MSKYKFNPLLEEQIMRRGVTVGLPLFEQPKDTADQDTRHLPHWVWDGSGIKAEIYNKLKHCRKWKQNQLEVMQAMITLGGSATDNELKEVTELEINIVTARRNDLVQLGLVTSFPDNAKPKKSNGEPQVKKKLGPHGVANTLWFVNFKNLYNRLFS